MSLHRSPGALRAPALRRPVRWPAAASAVAAAVAHMPPVADHLHEAPWAGIAFIALGVLFPMLAALLLVRDSRATWAASGALALAALVAYVLSRSVGLPQLGDDVGDWTGDPWGVLAIVAEGALVLLAAAALLLPSTRAPIPRRTEGATRGARAGARS